MNRRISHVWRVVGAEIFRTRIAFRVVKHKIFSASAEPILHLDIETTTYCNRRCSYCPNSVFERSLRKNEHLMAPALFRKIVDELADISFKGSLSPHLYGEPLTDSRLISFMDYAHAMVTEGQNCSIYKRRFSHPDVAGQTIRCGGPRLSHYLAKRRQDVAGR
jgi:hypothetical protein